MVGITVKPEITLKVVELGRDALFKKIKEFAVFNPPEQTYIRPDGKKSLLVSPFNFSEYGCIRKICRVYKTIHSYYQDVNYATTGYGANGFALTSKELSLSWKFSSQKYEYETLMKEHNKKVMKVLERGPGIHLLNISSKQNAFVIMMRRSKSLKDELLALQDFEKEGVNSVFTCGKPEMGALASHLSLTSNPDELKAYFTRPIYPLLGTFRSNYKFLSLDEKAKDPDFNPMLTKMDVKIYLEIQSFLNQCYLDSFVDYIGFSEDNKPKMFIERAKHNMQRIRATATLKEGVLEPLFGIKLENFEYPHYKFDESLVVEDYLTTRTSRSFPNKSDKVKKALAKPSKILKEISLISNNKANSS